MLQVENNVKCLLEATTCLLYITMTSPLPIRCQGFACPPRSICASLRERGLRFRLPTQIQNRHQKTPHVCGDLGRWQRNLPCELFESLEPRSCNLPIQNLPYREVLRPILAIFLESSNNNPFSQGDSGGPLMCRLQDGRWYMACVTSFGSGCAKRGFPDVFSNVPHYMDWIREVMKRHEKEDEHKEPSWTGIF